VQFPAWGLLALVLLVSLLLVETVLTIMSHHD
jgi:hypothetical protein